MSCLTRITKNSGACGISTLYGFGEQGELGLYRQYAGVFEVGDLPARHGAGFLQAAFIDTPACKKVYKLLSDKYPILYQSPVRLNTNSNNQFFFCIFDSTIDNV